MPIKDSVTAFVVLADSSVTGFTGNLTGANLLVGLLRLARFFVTYIEPGVSTLVSVFFETRTRSKMCISFEMLYGN